MANPFESPREVASPVTEEAALSTERSVALKQYKRTILILALPAVANLLLFNYFVTGQVTQPWLFYLFAALNAIGVALVISGIFFGGFFLLELFTRLANGMFGRRERLDHWYESLFAIVRLALILAIPAAALWAFWLAMCYGTDAPFFLYSIPVALVAHLMAASLYCGLFWRWYQVRRLV